MAITSSAGDSQTPSLNPKQENRPKKRLKPGMSDYLAGEDKDFQANLLPYLPQEMVGGSVPYIPGTEDDAVWNAASQACGTEKVHYCYTVEDNRIWYLACPSSSMASNPDSWCPLASALPGNSEYWDRETVYLFEHDGLASALRWDPETGRMQVFLGAARTILPRVQSMDANFVTINSEVADVVPWKNKALHNEKLSRATVRTLVFIGMVIALVSILVLAVNFVMINTIERNLAQVKAQTDKAAADLMINAYNAMQSDTIRHMVRVQELLDELAKVNGTLVRYEVNQGRVEWEALVPQAFAQEFGTPLGLEDKDPFERVRIRNTR